MSAFHPITPLKAVQLVESAGVADGRRLIADFAAAGLVKSYALVIETIPVADATICVRGAMVPTDLWQRIIREGALDDVWTGGTVRLPAAELVGGLPEVRITGMGFKLADLQRMIDHHSGRASPKAREGKAASTREQPVEPALVQAIVVARSQPNLSAIPPGAIVVTVKQAQAALGLGRTKVTELMNDGRLVRSKIDGAVRIEVTSILKLAGASFKGGTGHCLGTFAT